MISLSNRGMLWLALGFYAASLIFAIWRLAHGRPHCRWFKLGLVVPGFLFHTFSMWNRGMSLGHCPVSNLFETLTFIAWCLVALHLGITLMGRLNYVTAFYMPMVLAVQLAALLTPADKPGLDQWKQMSWLGLHASVIILGYAAFGLAGAVSLMYLLQERQLRKRRLNLSFMLLPPILRLEAVQGWLLAAGFLLLSLGLVSGFAGLHLIQRNNPTRMDPKLVWSLAVWGMYFILVLGRFRWGISARRMAWLSIAGCLLIFNTFWLANALSQFHHY
ncbi:MAG: cytochrome c biogenesis protein CcsA [Verrucomicrobia bacterium]|nr:cytochrome c biogenesis protein CcsA [Verrucomicrobiota bacterium]